MTIALGMMVKNEAHVIVRCLASVRPLISAWHIVDTGSTDGTQALVRESLAGIPGTLGESDWLGYGATQDLVFDGARKLAGYVLFIDADETVRLTGSRASLVADGYYVRQIMREFEFSRLRILKSDKPWKFSGQRHSIPACPGATLADWEGVEFVNGCDSAQSKQDPEAVRARYRRDVEHFLAELEKNPTNTRAAFYLAQSYKDSWQADQALEAYERRAAMPGGFEEETWWSLYQAACLRDQRGDAPEIVIAAYQRAHNRRPQRAEAMWSLAKFLRRHKQFAPAVAAAETASSTPKPAADRFFMWGTVYDWRALDELAMAHCGLEQWREAAAANERILSTSTRIGPADRLRVERNLEYCRGRLGNDQPRPDRPVLEPRDRRDADARMAS
jgi:glycosyltransferase involved in cell wall biosynthesis